MEVVPADSAAVSARMVIMSMSLIGCARKADAKGGLTVVEDKNTGIRMCITRTSLQWFVFPCRRRKRVAGCYGL